MSFFKSVLSTITGLLIFNLIAVVLFFLVVVGIVGVIGLNSESIPDIESNSVLRISLSGGISERVPENPFAELFPESDNENIALLSSITAIKNAKNDDRIKGIYLDHGYISSGYASLTEIRGALVDFKTSGKFVYSYAEHMSEANYYIGSVADEIFLNPAGDMEFNGLSANVSFFKGLLDKLEIEAQVFRVGTYKSAVEPFIRKDMSDANKEQTTALITDLYTSYLKKVSQSRNIDIVKLKEISDKMLIRKPEDALSLNMITAIGYSSDFRNKIKETLELEAGDKINSVSLNDYIKSIEPEYSANKIAVIVAEGEIVSGKGDADRIGSKKFAKAIRNARENKRVKAVVIRINSPGGSALASDVMWNEIMLTKEVKPVIASMSAVAASGGYYMAMPCDTIVAQPMTITGSIGIFGMIPNVGKFLENKLGITSDYVMTGKYSDLYRVSTGLSDQEKNIIQTKIEHGYESFTSKAAEGRNMSIEDLKAVASGRVWTGNQAKQNGLVDVLGSYQDAVEIAAAAADVQDDYMVTYYPTLKSKWEEFFGNIASETEARIMKNQYGEMAKYIDLIKDLKNQEGIQARMPFELEIK